MATGKYVTLMITALVGAIAMILSGGIASAQIHLDLSMAQVEVQPPETLVIRQISVPGYGNYWVQLQWDAGKLTFAPVAYGVESASDPLLAKTQLLQGNWHFVETIGTAVFTDDYALTTIDGTRNDQGGYFIYGTDQYGDLVAASYFPNDGNWALLDPSPYIFDSFFTFYTDGNTILPGSCYYLVYHPTATEPNGHWSQCYQLTGVKTSPAAAERARRDSSERASEQATRAQETEALPQGTVAPISPDVIEKYLLLKRAVGE
jgi:hypothetical protein